VEDKRNSHRFFLVGKC